jgi:HlyD family secretion protein
VKVINRFVALCLILCVNFFVASCHKEKNALYPGYIEGKFTYISTYYKGILDKLNVNPGDQIKKGQALFILEPFPQSADLMAANARVQQALDEKNKNDANYNLQKTNNARNLILFKKDVISKEELDQSNSDYHTAEASQKAAEANLLIEQANQKKAFWASGQKLVTAPMDALVFDTYYSVHENVAEGKPILSLLDPNSIKIIFYVPQKQLSLLQLKQEIQVSYDGAQQPLIAKITYISPKEEYTPPVIFSEAERQSLVYRIEAHPLDKNSYLKIHPGQPVSVKLNGQNMPDNYD